MLRDLAGGPDASRSDMEKTRRALHRLADEHLVEVGRAYDETREWVVARKFWGQPLPNLPYKKDEEIRTDLWVEAELVNEMLQVMGSRYRIKVERVAPTHQAQVISLNGTPLFESPYEPRLGVSLAKGPKRLQSSSVKG